MQNSAARRVTSSGTKKAGNSASGDAPLVVEHDLCGIAQELRALDPVGECRGCDSAGADRDRAQVIGRQREAVREVGDRRLGLGRQQAGLAPA